MPLTAALPEEHLSPASPPKTGKIGTSPCRKNTSAAPIASITAGELASSLAASALCIWLLISDHRCQFSLYREQPPLKRH